MRTASSGRGGLLLGLFYSALPVIPCAVVLGSYTWPFLAIWTVFGGVRRYSGDRKILQDCWTFAGVNVLLLWKELWNLVQKKQKELDSANVVALSSPTLLVLGVAVPLTLFWISHHGTSRNTNTDPSQGIPDSRRRWPLEHPRPRIFPCRTTHARIFPKRHAFGYSYLLCGFPIVPAGTVESEGDISVSKDTDIGSWWLRIRAEDYLERGQGNLGFYGKLKLFLRNQGVEDSEWSYAYLVTAPRFFGYSFNPVSFWYIYNAQHELKRMILEVNNTFGERRIYLLDGSSSPSPLRTSGSEESALDQPRSMKKRFTDIWMKDFHVSPFNSRKGSYALKALNPFPHPSFETPDIDNTITLKSSKDHAKLVARVHTTNDPIDPAELGILGTVRFVLSWWWVGLMTSPRILREAFKLYFWRSLHVWFRPEVLSPSIARAPTSMEIGFQEVCRDYLNYLVHQSSEPFSISYRTAIPDRPEQIVTTAYQAGRQSPIKNLEIHVLTPAFYSRVVHYAHTSEALDRECLFTDEKNRTLWISQPELLPLLLPRSKSQLMEGESLPVRRNYIDELRWLLLRRLRCAPPEPAYPVTPKSTDFSTNDIRSLPYSELDIFVRSARGCCHAGNYRRAATKLFLAQRFAFGFTEIVDALDFGLRLVLCYIASKKLRSLALEAQRRGLESGIQRILLNPRADIGTLVGAQAEWWWLSELAMWICTCHLFALLKGYS